MLRRESFKGLPTIPDRHVQVEQSKVHRGLIGEFERLLSVLSRNDGVTFNHEDRPGRGFGQGGDYRGG